MGIKIRHFGNGGVLCGVCDVCGKKSPSLYADDGASERRCNRCQRKKLITGLEVTLEEHMTPQEKAARLLGEYIRNVYFEVDIPWDYADDLAMEEIVNMIILACKTEDE